MSATQPVPYDETIVKRYVEMFESESIQHDRFTHIPPQLGISWISNEKIQVEAPDRSTRPVSVIGYCYLPNPSSPILAIDQGYWGNSPTEERLALVFHELGHCLLYREHNDGMIQVHGMNYPSSLMHSILIPGPYLWAHWDYYLDELFLAENPDPLIW